MDQPKSSEQTCYSFHVSPRLNHPCIWKELGGVTRGNKGISEKSITGRDLQRCDFGFGKPGQFGNHAVGDAFGFHELCDVHPLF